MSWTLIAAVNNDEVLRECLELSPDLSGADQVIYKRGHSSASTAYNTGLDEATCDIVVFAHQDVYFPAGWAACLFRCIRVIEQSDPAWGVLGVYGMGFDGHPCGHIHSTGLRRTLGQPFKGVREAMTLDEMVLVVRRSSGLRFDPNLPGFHLYGTDICLEAKRTGMRCYVIPAFCIHNSIGIRVLPVSFWKAYLYLRRKWWNRLPIPTCCTTITPMCHPMLSYLFKAFLSGLLISRRTGGRISNPEILYRHLVEIGMAHSIVDKTGLEPEA